jgi:acetyltransferase-like isoleucine patch superfamily enzyme
MLNRFQIYYRRIKNSFDKYSPFLWMYAAYLTLRYVDKYSQFPAFKFNGKVKVKIVKGLYSQLNIGKRLIFENWLNGNTVTTITLRNHASMNIANEFVLGDGIRIFVSSGGYLVIKGKKNEPFSGITADSVVMVKKYVELGEDALIAWNTFITDCDWHGVEGKQAVKDTIIKDHVWLGVGAKVLKGAVLESECIVTTNSVVLQGVYPSKSLIGGNPAKILKQNAPAWSHEMHPYEA